MATIKLSAAQIRIINALRNFVNTEFTVTNNKLSTENQEALVAELAQFAPVNPRSINALIKALQGGSSTVPPVAATPIVEEALPVAVEVVETPAVVVAPVTKQTEEDWLLSDEPVVDHEKLAAEGSLSLGASNIAKLRDCSWRKPAQPTVQRDWWAIKKTSKTLNTKESRYETNGNYDRPATQEATEAEEAFIW